MVSVSVIDHTVDFENAMKEQVEAALEAVGHQAVSYAKNNLTGATHGTGALRNSITHRVRMGEKAVYIGTNVEYAKYVEMGTGQFADGGGGRQGYWVYVTGGGKRGTNTGKVYSFEEAKKIMAILQSKGLDAHMTNGRKPVHFLKNAASEHANQYRGIIEYYLKK